MALVTLEDRDETVLAARDRFGAPEADELHALLLEIDRARPVTVDLREVRGIEDFVLARLAQDFARRRLRVLGLSEHQHRILRYFAPPCGAEPPQRTSR